MAKVNIPDHSSWLRLTASCALLVFCFTLAGVGMADEGDQSFATAEYSKGAKRCMTCHKEGKARDAHEIFMTPMGISRDPDSPFAEGRHDCETCHGPSKKHPKRQKDGSRTRPSVVFDETTPAAIQNAVCLGCHKGNPLFHWAGGMHDEEELACASCHTVHAERDPVFDPMGQQKVCFSCHMRIRSETFRNSSHPLRYGEMSCTDCHNPHDSDNDFLLKRATINDTCYTCHAEKRGPFLWEHAPASEDCSLCHNPHGSNHAALLKQRPPLLCQQCHAPSGHPSVAYASDTAENSLQQRFLLGRACINCHSQVHGSNHPSGSTITR